MKQQILPPRMQDAEEADLRAKMLRIRGDFNEGFSYRTEQQIVQFDFILPDEIRQIVRQTEHDMGSNWWPRVPALWRRSPSLACLRLTLGTMPVPARVKGEAPSIPVSGSAKALERFKTRIREITMGSNVTNSNRRTGPVRTVVWQGSVGDRRPYADQVGYTEK